MYTRLHPRVWAALLLLAARGVAQVKPAGESGRPPLAIGAGVSNFDVDWGHGRMWGATAWADWGWTHGPNWLHGLSLSGEVRYVGYGHSASQQDVSEGTAWGGATYTWRGSSVLRPYGKFIMSYGSISGFDFPQGNGPAYTHDTRTAYAPGAGLEYRLTRHFWLRADYGYQWWRKLFINGRTLDPQGFTVGAMYNLRELRRHW